MPAIKIGGQECPKHTLPQLSSGPLGRPRGRQALNVQDIRTLYAYNSWANSRVLAAVRVLQPEDFTRDFGTSHGSVKGTLIHMLLGEWRWTQFWRGESEAEVRAHTEVEWASRFSEVPAIEARWALVENDRRAFIDNLTEEQLEHKLRVRRGEFSLGLMMLHLANHSSYHRGQLVGLLRQLGQKPPSTDFIEFLQMTNSSGAA